MSSPEVVVDIKGLTKKYGDFTALDSLSMQVGKGQILGFIGPNGAGKTTMIKILVGLLKATSGEASIAGVDCLSDTRKLKRLVGYMPDVFGKYNNMRVSEYLDFFGAAYGIGRRQRRLRIDEVLEIAGATYMKDLFVDALSRGMQQRVGLARTLIHDPEVVILDEPANGLDPQARIDMRTTLLQLSERGTTLIVTSHILTELSRICDLVAMITRGKLRAQGTVDEIMQSIRQKRTFEILLVSEDQVDRVQAVVKDWLADHETSDATDDSNEASRVWAAPAESTVRFTTSLRDEAIAPLLVHLINSGERVVQFRDIPTDLEDAFLSVAYEGNEDSNTQNDQAVVGADA